MYDDFAPRLAHILTEFSIPVQKGDYVVITGSTMAEPLILALYEAVLRRGGHPIVRVGLAALDEIFLALAGDDQLDFCDPLTLALIEKVDVLYQISAPANTKNLAQVDPARLRRMQQGRRPITERYFQRINDGSLRWNISAWPTQGAAQEAEMGLLAYTGFMYRACALDRPDPIAHWQALREHQDRLIAWLTGKHHAEVRGPGIALDFDFTDRLWVNSWGDNNFPDGEIFTSPVEDSVNGEVAFNYPTVEGGREVSGVKLTFKEGRVIQASAAKGEDYLLSQLDRDDGARRLGEFAIGTNYGIQQFTGETLFDEKIGGTVHMALGEGFKEANGVNTSAIHWDMVHGMRDGGEIRIDGTLFYQNGVFVVDGA
jgi:aminopeptidase